MWSRLAKYLVPGSGKSPDGVTAIPVEARVRQVEVEGDDWILIDRNVEGVGALDESWYVTPPACFTQPGPVHVETSPLEDLLIEHPSMSVYRSAGSVSLGCDGKSAEKKLHHQRPGKRGLQPQPAPPTTTQAPPGKSRVPLAARSANLMMAGQEAAGPTTGLALAAATTTGQPASTGAKLRAQPVPGVGEADDGRPGHHHHHHSRRPLAAHNAGAIVERAPRRATMRDLRKARGDENVRILQIRSAQKMLEKHSSQSTKRNRLERSNKAREVSSGKGRRPRRQDRLRLNNSGANNNRKC